MGGAAKLYLYHHALARIARFATLTGLMSGRFTATECVGVENAQQQLAVDRYSAALHSSN